MSHGHLRLGVGPVHSIMASSLRPRPSGSLPSQRAGDAAPSQGGNVASHCSRIEHCELYPLFLLRASLRTWQIRYCEADYRACERFRLAERGEPMPSNLLPNGKLLPLVKKDP